METLTEFGVVTPQERLAFGVDPTRRELYSLRQSRYQALGENLNRLAAENEARGGGSLKLLDVGSRQGVLKRYLDAWPHARTIKLYGVDIKPPTRLYKADEWAMFWIGDLMEGFPEIPSEHFDIAVCEQVLEHLPRLETATKTLERVLKPGGTLIVGVPIFPHGAHLLRRHVTPLIDRIIPPNKVRGHVQAFSRRTFLQVLREQTDLEIMETRGFRVISGGILRPLEERRGWWRFNRWLGRKAPGLCVEIQVIARKGDATSDPKTNAALGGRPLHRLRRSPSPASRVRNQASLQHRTMTFTSASRAHAGES